MKTKLLRRRLDLGVSPATALRTDLTRNLQGDLRRANPGNDHDTDRRNDGQDHDHQ